MEGIPTDVRLPSRGSLLYTLERKLQREGLVSRILKAHSQELENYGWVCTETFHKWIDMVEL